MKGSRTDANDLFVEIGGGKLPRSTWGYTYISWPLMRLRLSATRVRFEPSLFSNWILFRLPTWEAGWDELASVTAAGSEVRFTRKAGVELTYFTMGDTERLMAWVPERLRRV
jgi:hypothetical protein